MFKDSTFRRPRSFALFFNTHLLHCQLLPPQSTNTINNEDIPPPDGAEHRRQASLSDNML